MATFRETASLYCGLGIMLLVAGSFLGFTQAAVMMRGENAFADKCRDGDGAPCDAQEEHIGLVRGSTPLAPRPVPHLPCRAADRRVK